MSEEVLQAAGDLAYWFERAVRAESDVAALSAAISAYIAAGDTHARAEAWRAMRDLAETAHPGAALLAELHAARAVVEAARAAISHQSWGIVGDALDTYDAVRQGRME